MKAFLENELCTLAQSIINSKGSMDLPTLKREAEKLHEKITILGFVEKYYQTLGASPERMQYTMKKVSTFIEEQQHDDIFDFPVEATPVKPIAFVTHENVAPKNQSVYAEQSAHDRVLESYRNSVQEANQVVAKEYGTPQPMQEYTSNQNLEDFIPQTQHPVFEKKEEIIENKTTPSLNDRLGKNTQIGLNDRLAFIRQLFLGSESEYNRVVQHINELQSVQDIAIYVEQEVKPIYNHWRGKEEYEERFLSFMLKRFEV